MKHSSPLFALTVCSLLAAPGCHFFQVRQAAKQSAPAPVTVESQPVQVSEKGQSGTTPTAAGANAGAEAAAGYDERMDWTHWRGPEQNGISREIGLVDSFDPRTKKNLLWKRDDLGTRSTPIVMNGKFYIQAPADLGTKTEGERVVCLNPATGKTIWETKFNVYLSDAPAERAGWSCVTGDPETGNVYSLGMCGLFQCLDGATGKVKWSYSMHEQFGLLSTYGGRTNSPRVFEDLVIISAIVIGWSDMARPAHRFLGLDKRTGEVRWFEGTRPLPYDTTYGSPVITMLGGQMAMVFGSGDGGVWALQPRTGKQIWKYQLSRAAGINVTPIVSGGTVFSAHSEENVDDNTMGALVAINGGLKNQLDITKNGELWRHKQIVAGRSSPMEINGRLYIIDDRAKLWIYDAKSGKQLGAKEGEAPQPNFRLGSVMRASPLYADGKMYLCTNTGKWYVLRIKEDGGVEPIKQGRRDFLRLQTECYGAPIASHGRIYLPTVHALYCLGEKGTQPKLGPGPELPQEPAAADDAQPAHVQVVPAEAVLAPGKSQQFKVRLFNARGQFLKESPAKFTVSAGGKITDGGEFAAAETAEHTAATITATVGELSGRARVRIIPPLPWKFDFSKGVVPVTWIGMRHRHISLDADLRQELRAHDVKNGTRAAPLYEKFTFDFFVGQKPRLVYNDAPPLKPWTALLKYLETPDANLPTQDDAKKFFNPSLDLLVEKKVLKGYRWDADGKKILTVDRGSREIGPSQAMFKMDSIPVPRGTTQLGTRSRGWIGPADLHDYTIATDVMATTKPGRGGVAREVGDIGLIAQGYTFVVLGSNKKLQIRRWDTQLRMAVTIPYEMTPDVWYRMKFRAANVGENKVDLRGKIWPKDKPEPGSWTLMATEEGTPQRRGAPGFFGTAREPGSPFYLDNVAVTPNK